MTPAAAKHEKQTGAQDLSQTPVPRRSALVGATALAATRTEPRRHARRAGTDSGLWSVTPGGSVAAIRTIDFGGLYPVRMVADSTGRLYVGMRRFVATLTESREGLDSDMVRADRLCACGGEGSILRLSAVEARQ